jgi:CBS domain-containing protein
MKCFEIMTANPYFCNSEVGIGEAVRIMWEHDCGDVPVTNGIDGGELIGVITDRDIAMHVVTNDACPSDVKVSDCMSSPVITCNGEDSIEKAMEIMSEKQIRRVPVVDENGKCIGIISQADLISHAEEIGDAWSIMNTLSGISTPGGKAMVVKSKSESVISTGNEKTAKEKNKSK